MKKFKCGLCREDRRIYMTRKDLRKHLADNHRILTNKFNVGNGKNIGNGKLAKHKNANKLVRQNWVMEEEC